MANEKKSTSFALNIEKAFSRYYKKFGEDREMPVATWKQWFERLPASMMQAIPLALQLVAITYGLRYCLAWYFGSHWVTFSTLPEPFGALLWIGLFTFIIGSRIANYAEGVLKPTLLTVLKTLRSNWIMVLLISVLLLSVDLSGKENANIRVNNLNMSFIIILILFGIQDLKALKPKRTGKSEEPK